MVNKYRVVIESLLAVWIFLLSACSGTQAASTDSLPEVVDVYASQAAQPWLGVMFACADAYGAIIRLNDPANAQVVLRVGEPNLLEGFAYQVGEEEIALAVHPENPAAFISQAQVQGLFSGDITNWLEVTGVEAPVQVWVFAPQGDLGEGFNSVVLGAGFPVSTARLAAAGEELRAEIARDVNAIGYIGRRSAGTDIRLIPLENPLLLPVLAITSKPPDGVLVDVLGCMQQKNAP